MAIGDEIIDLGALINIGLLDGIEINTNVFYSDSLNEYIGLGKTQTNQVRLALQNLLIDQESPLRDHPSLFVKQDNATMHLPVHVGDYTDFYSSIEHATNVGKMFRDPANALLPNWKHMPVGYHGRASSIVVSGTNIIRPSGQIKPPDGGPIFAASRRLDFELEMGIHHRKRKCTGNPNHHSRCQRSHLWDGIIQMIGRQETFRNGNMCL